MTEPRRPFGGPTAEGKGHVEPAGGLVVAVGILGLKRDGGLAAQLDRGGGQSDNRLGRVDNPGRDGDRRRGRSDWLPSMVAVMVFVPAMVPVKVAV